MQYLSFILFAIATVFNSIMDTLMWHFPNSVFKKLNSHWWNPNESWMYVSNFLGIVRLDAWHLAKYGMLFGFIGSAITYRSLFGVFDFGIYLLIWFVFFELPWRLFYQPK